ncbi:fungal-specific transcription factor domain protein [Xylaria arbuscula]|nr:fungal-specific transcription factor domain protein [Xylaria arbuscula]
MQERIDQLENLVLSLMHQTTTDSGSRHPRSGLSPPELISNQATTAAPRTQSDVSPTPSDNGSIRIQQTVISYVSSSHWAAVLDTSDPVLPLAKFPKPQLLYSGLKHETSDMILKSLPPRPVVDRLVSRYFNILDIAPGVVHSGQFLRELQQSFLVPPKASPAAGQPQIVSQATEAQATADKYKEQAVQCLMLGHYTKGGPYVLETLILYFLVECFHMKDTPEIGIWVLVGNIVQIAIHMGYHRDAKHFPNITPFVGEMRRRVWAMIVQLYMSISTQLGLPRLVKESQTNTAEPRNLFDSDFDEHTPEIPASRPETEVTPTLYVLAKLRLLSVGVKVADVATESRLHSYDEAMSLDKQINEARDALLSSLKWNGLASSLNVPSQMIIQRIWLEIIVLQLKIVLHKKFIDPSCLDHQSRSICFSAAMEILELQRLVDEETQIDGLLYQNRWRVSSAFTNDFLLATSILCFYLKTHTEKRMKQPSNSEDGKIEETDIEKVKRSLTTSKDIWSRQCDSSREARKATAALHYVLGNTGARFKPDTFNDATPLPFPPTTVSHFSGLSDFIQEYDFSNLESENTNGRTIWPLFTAERINQIEEWAEITDSHEMNMSF